MCIQLPVSQPIANRPTVPLPRRKHVVVVDNCSMHNDPQGKELIEGEYKMFFDNKFVVLRDELRRTHYPVYEL